MIHSRFVVAFGFVACTVLFTSSVYAEETVQAPPPSSDTVTEPPAEVKGTTHEQRVRVGLDVHSGAATYSGASGVVLGSTLRLGWQANDLIGIYANLSTANWSTGSVFDRNTVIGNQLTPLVSFSPVSALELAVGPSFDYFVLSSSRAGDAGSTSKSASLDKAIGFGAHGRVALHLGGRYDFSGHNTFGARRGFTLAADVHSTFSDMGPVAMATIGIGYDWR